MPKQGPKKFTKRDERDVDRARKSSQLQRAEELAQQREKAIAEYKMQRNPNIPSTKRDQRTLRAALAAEGISMTVWNSGTDLSPFAHIARERFVNHKYAIPVEDKKEDFETDPWLQMFLQVPESYRQEVIESSTAADLPKPHTLDFSDLAEKPKRVKMSRRQAKEAAERASRTVEAVPPAPNQETQSESVKGTVEVAEATASSIDTKTESTIAPAHVPVGKVRIQSSADGTALAAEASGQLSWVTTNSTSGSTESPTTDTVWELQITSDGKYTFRSAHGKYLSHCLMWGLVANRAVASDWEKFALTTVRHGEEMLVTFQTWRGGYLSTAGAAVGTVSTVSAKERFAVCLV